MGRKARPLYVEPEDESQEIPEPEHAPVAVSNGRSEKKVSKSDAVRAAIRADVGKPDEGVDFLRREFGIEMTKQQFSTLRSKLKPSDTQAAATQPKPKGKPGRKPKAKPSLAVEGYLAPPPKPARSGDEADLIASLEALKPLVAALGAEKVKRLADLLG